MSYLDNGTLKVGVDLDLGGAITYLSPSGRDLNLINSYDWGRQVQMSHYSGPVPFVKDGKEPKKEWAGLGWNPIQSGDCHGKRSKVLEHGNDGKVLHVKCIPMQWPMDDVPAQRSNSRADLASCSATAARHTSWGAFVGTRNSSARRRTAASSVGWRQGKCTRPRACFGPSTPGWRSAPSTWKWPRGGLAVAILARE